MANITDLIMQQVQKAAGNVEIPSNVQNTVLNGLSESILGSLTQTATKAGGIDMIKSLLTGKTNAAASPVTALAGKLFTSNILSKLHLGNLLFLGIGIFAGLTSRWILLGVTVLALLLTIVMRTLNGRKALRMFDVNIPTWKIYFYELSVLRHTILTHLRYEYADKNDFISHKV